MITKIFEWRWHGYSTPDVLIAIKPEAAAAPDDNEQALLARIGLGDPALQRAGVILLWRIVGATEADGHPYVLYVPSEPNFMGKGFLSEAYRYIADHWDKLPSGAVIDTEMLNGERAQPRNPSSMLPHMPLARNIG